MSYFARLAATLQAIDPRELAALRRFVAECTGTLYIAGNGGSYAASLHWACDLQKAAGRRVVALGANASLMTAWANDESYAYALVNELECVTDTGDRLLLLSCSGTSSNIQTLRASATEWDMRTALITSDCYEGDATLRIPARDYGVIEDCFGAIGHWLTGELRHA